MLALSVSRQRETDVLFSPLKVAKKSNGHGTCHVSCFTSFTLRGSNVFLERLRETPKSRSRHPDVGIMQPLRYNFALPSTK